MVASNGVSVKDRLLWITNLVYHQVTAVLVAFVVVNCCAYFPLDTLNTWHIILTTIGTLVLMLEGFNVFLKENLFTLYVSRTKKQTIHALLLALSTLLITIGIGFKIAAITDDPNASHFSTAHSIIGLCAWMLMLLSCVMGVVAGQAQKLKKLARPVWLKFIHNGIGCLALILALTTLGFGVYKSFFKALSTEKTVMAAVITGAIVACWTIVLGPLRSCVNQIRDIVGR